LANDIHEPNANICEPSHANVSAKSLKLVADAVAIEPVSHGNSLQPVRKQGIFGKIGTRKQFWPQMLVSNQPLTGKFPKPWSREFWRACREFSDCEQRNFSPSGIANCSCGGAATAPRIRVHFAVLGVDGER